MPTTEDADIKRWFRDRLRDARAAALRDAEGCDEIILTLERLGLVLEKKTITLRRFKNAICAQASSSPLAKQIPEQFPAIMMPFDLLYDYVVQGRNAAFHEGAYGRHLTTHAVILSTILEHALMNELKSVRDFMVPNPVCAELWHPVSFVRQTMLANSFSHLPLKMGDANSKQSWTLVSSEAVAHCLRFAPDPNQKLATTLEDAINSGDIKTLIPKLAKPASSIQQAMLDWNGVPILVIRDGAQDLLGILTAFDLL